MTTGIKEENRTLNPDILCSGAPVPDAPYTNITHTHHRISFSLVGVFSVFFIFIFDDLCVCMRHSSRHSASRKTISSSSPAFHLNGMAMFGPRPRQIQWISFYTLLSIVLIIIIVTTFFFSSRSLFISSVPFIPFTIILE